MVEGGLKDTDFLRLPGKFMAVVSLKSGMT